MFKERAKFNKFLLIATPILCGANLLIVLLKFIGAFATSGPFEQRMFMFATMFNDPAALVSIHYMLCGLLFTANIAYGVLSFVALSMIKDDEKHRKLSLIFAIITFALLTTLMFLGFVIDASKVSYWVIPIWFIVIAFHVTFAVVFFSKYARLKKQ